MCGGMQGTRITANFFGGDSGLFGDEGPEFCGVFGRSHVPRQGYFPSGYMPNGDRLDFVPGIVLYQV